MKSWVDLLAVLDFLRGRIQKIGFAIDKTVSAAGVKTNPTP